MILYDFRPQEGRIWSLKIGLHIPAEGASSSKSIVFKERLFMYLLILSVCSIVLEKLEPMNLEKKTPFVAAVIVNQCLISLSDQSLYQELFSPMHRPSIK